MIEIITVKSHKSGDDRYNGSPDAEFMENCRRVDENRPATWSKYDNTLAGANDIIIMECNELIKDIKNNDEADWEQNLYHLSVALLNAWRIKNAK